VTVTVTAMVLLAIFSTPCHTGRIGSARLLAPLPLPSIGTGATGTFPGPEQAAAPPPPFESCGDPKPQTGRRQERRGGQGRGVSGGGGGGRQCFIIPSIPSIPSHLVSQSIDLIQFHQ
jgi:hypothetical protein